MITKAQIRNLKDQNNHFVHIFEVDWNETSLSRLYDKMDAQIEGGALVDILKAEPISFDESRGMLSVEITMDVSDLFEDGEDVEDDA